MTKILRSLDQIKDQLADMFGPFGIVYFDTVFNNNNQNVHIIIN